MNKKYKGVCEITLMDEKNQVVNQTRDENMLTNAVANLFKCDAIDLALSQNGYNYLSALYTNFLNFYAGVLLFSETINENADVIYPQSNNINLGHAGGLYAGVNTFRGSLNSTESCVVENGYKFVWDFPTNVANGTIKCVSLTSLWGGNCGYDNSVADSDAQFYIPINKGNYTQNSTAFAPNRIIKKLADGSLLLVKTSGQVFTLSKMKFYDKASISNSNNTSSIETVATYTSISAVDNPTILFITSDYILSVNNLNSTTLHYCKINHDGQKIADKNITMSQQFTGAANVKLFGEIGNDIIILDTSSHFWKVNNITGAVTEITCPYGLPTYPTTTFDLNGRVVFSNMYSYSSNAHQSLMYDGAFHLVPTSTGASESQDETIGVIDLSNPNVMMTLNSYNYAWYGNYRMIAPYLATIDNLATPVTKTASLSMKVTYTITEVVVNESTGDEDVPDL